MADSLLIIEDEKLLGTELARLFGKHGWEVELVADLAQARKKLFEIHDDPLVILADMSLPDGNSLYLVEEARASGTLGEWIILTAYGSVPD